MNKAYERINWQNKPSTATKLNATNLNKMDLGLDTIDDRVIDLDYGKMDKSVVKTGNPVTFNTVDGEEFSKAEVTFTPIQDTSQGDPSPDHICPITGYSELNIYQSSGSTITPDETYTQSLGGTYYAGTYNFTTGKLKATWGIIDMGTLNWMRNAQYNVMYILDLPNKKTGGEFSFTNIISDRYKVVSKSYQQLLDGEISGAQTALAINIKDDRYNDPDVFKTAMNGAQLVYELATPIEVTLTPTQLSTLLGENVMWTDGDTLSVIINAIDSQDIAYDNTSSGLTATNVQDAIDELKALISALGS